MNFGGGIVETVADPYWIRALDIDYSYMGLKQQLNSSFLSRAFIPSAYGDSLVWWAPNNHEIYRWRIGYIFQNKIDMYVSTGTEQTWSFKKVATMMSKFDEFTSAFPLGNRHMVVTTNGNVYPFNQTDPDYGGSQIGRVVMIDMNNFGFGYDKPYAAQLVPNNADAKRSISSSDPYYSPTIFGCHADSYANETLMNSYVPTQLEIYSNYMWKPSPKPPPMQPFYMVCMSLGEKKEDTPQTIVLTSYKVNVHTYEGSPITVTDWMSYSIEKFVEATAVVPGPEINATFVSTLQTFPVHVVDKNIVLYRCLKKFADFAGMAHWCWRSFDRQYGWGTEYPALTTDSGLEESVLQKGMFIGWSGSEDSLFETNSRRLYFLDRQTRKLYTLVVDDTLRIVTTNALTAVYPKSTYRNSMHFPIPSRNESGMPLYFHGHIHHQYDRYNWYSRSTPPPSFGEYLYLTYSDEKMYGDRLIVSFMAKYRFFSIQPLLLLLLLSNTI
jgi:hypothetical protein